MAAKKKPAALALTIPATNTLAEGYRQDAVELATELRKDPMVVASDVQAERVGALIAEIATQKRELDQAMKAITQPINEGLKQAKALFKPAIDALDGVEKTLRTALGAYRLQQHNAVMAARERALEAVEAGDTDALHAALAVPEPVASDAATTTRFSWAVKHIDESKMTRDWLTADTAKLNAYCRATSGQDEIEPVAGVVFERKATVIRK